MVIAITTIVFFVIIDIAVSVVTVVPISFIAVIVTVINTLVFAITIILISGHLISIIIICLLFEVEFKRMLFFLRKFHLNLHSFYCFFLFQLSEDLWLSLN